MNPLTDIVRLRPYAYAMPQNSLLEVMLPQDPGATHTGVVESVGPDVLDVAPGDRVLYMNDAAVEAGEYVLIAAKFVLAVVE